MTGHERDETGASAPHGAADAALERAWRDASNEQPPAALDAAIVAAAGTSKTPAGDVRNPAVAARPRSSPPFARWQPLAAAAAVAGLALLLLQVLPREPGVTPAGPDQPRVESSESAAAAGPAAASTAAPPVAARKSVRADVEAMDAAPAYAAREHSETAPRPDPDAWAARIAALHAAGDLDAAAASLRSFRAADARADDFLPPPLHDWARTVE